MKDLLTKTLDTSRQYTLKVAEAMPEKNYAFKPSGAGWNFAELLSHIAYGIKWWQQNYVEETQTDWAPPISVFSKDAAIDALNKAYDDIVALVRKKELSEKQEHGVYTLLDHVTHHRGQLVLFLRLNGITPPDYTY